MTKKKKPAAGDPAEPQTYPDDEAELDAEGRPVSESELGNAPTEAPDLELPAPSGELSALEQNHPPPDDSGLPPELRSGAPAPAEPQQPPLVSGDAPAPAPPASEISEAGAGEVAPGLQVEPTPSAAGESVVRVPPDQAASAALVSGEDRDDAIAKLRAAIALKYSSDGADGFIAEHMDDLSKMPVAEILEAAMEVPDRGAPGSDVLEAYASVPATPTKNALVGPPVVAVEAATINTLHPITDPPNYYRVTQAGRFMLDGMIAALKVGQVINDRSNDVDALRKQGVSLEPCEAPPLYSGSI